VTDRQFFESLGFERGGLTEVDLKKFKIVDPIAELRLMFSGWISWVHWATILLFLTPYLFFTVSKFSHAWSSEASRQVRDKLDSIESALNRLPAYKSRISDADAQINTQSIQTTVAIDTPSESEEAFGWALLNYMCYGNTDSEARTASVWVPRAAWLAIFLIYNAARVMLLLKIKILEHWRNVSGVWPDFSFRDSVVGSIFLGFQWGHLKTVVKYGAYLALMSGLVTFIDILRIPVPN